MSKTRRGRGFTLVEMMVVIAIIGILVAITVPAISAARESARMSACKSNLRQFFIGMETHAARSGRYCTGAFDWKRDGAVTEIGWVADLAVQGTLVGKMLCPANPAKISRTYEDLLDLANPAAFSCLSAKSGTAPVANPDGTLKVNACRRILGDYAGGSPLPPGEERRLLVQEAIFNPGYNTNYAASWFLVRSGVTVDGSGNLTSAAGCTPLANQERHCTQGPLDRARADGCGISSSIVPMLADAQQANAILSAQMGAEQPGQPLAESYSRGPVSPSTMNPPSFAAGTTYDGPTGWWAGWNVTRQDYRSFGTPHARNCNILFLDGSVRNIADESGDGFLNNGFAPSGINGFNDDRVELPPHDVYSRWRLKVE